MVLANASFTMPPLRSRKYKERLELALLIEIQGDIMPSCTYCETNSRICVVLKENSSRCSECVRRGAKCDVSGPSAADLRSLIREQERLDEEEEKAASLMAVTAARLARLRKQRKFLQARGSELIRRGLKTMDELEEAEEKERLEKEKIEMERVEKETANVDAAPTPSGSSSFGFFDPSLPLLSEAELEALLAGVGTSGGMPVTSQGS